MNRKTLATLATLLALLPATALAEGGYVDSGGDCGAAAGALLLMLIVGFLVIAIGGRQ